MQLAVHHDLRRAHFRDRSHFLAMSSRLMRRLLVDQARARRAAKRGGGGAVIALEETLALSEQQSDALHDLNDALERLEAIDPRQGQIVEQRYFGGLTLDEIAGAHGLSLATVKRWLNRGTQRVSALVDADEGLANYLRERAVERGKSDARG